MADTSLTSTFWMHIGHNQFMDGDPCGMGFGNPSAHSGGRNPSIENQDMAWCKSSTNVSAFFGIF